MECTWQVLLGVLEEPFPPVELGPCWVERENLAAVAWPMVSWKKQEKEKKKRIEFMLFFSLT